MRSSLVRAVSLLAAALLAPWILSGCYAAAAGAVLGLLAATDNSGGGSPDRPPSQPVIPPPVRLDGAHVRVAYFLQDDRDGEIEVDLEWQPEDGTRDFAPATEWKGDPPLPGHPGTRSDGRRIRVEGGKSREAVFIWKALADLRPVPGGKSVARVQFRITPVAGGQVGQFALSEPFTAGNEVPEVIPPIEQGATGGVIPLAFDVRDSTSDPVTFEVDYRLGESGAWRSWRAGEMSLVGIAPGTRFEFRPEENGVHRVTLFWDTRRSSETATLASKEIHVRITPHDDYGSPDQSPRSEEAGPLTLDNNDDPDVEIIDLATAPDRSFEIPVRFVVRDQDEHPVNVVLQWAFQGEDFPELPIPRDASSEELFPSLDDIEFLEDLLSSDDPEVARLRRAHHICSEAELLVPASVDAFVLPFSLDGVTAPGEIRSISSYAQRNAPFCSLSLVRAGLVFRPPVQGRSRGLPEPPFTPASDIFLIGRGVLAYQPGVVSNPPGRIARFDPATSVAILEPGTETGWTAPPLPGSRLLVRANEGLVGLSSSREGLVHTFLWDSSRDMLGLGVPLNPAIRLRAVGIDSQVGPRSRESALFELQSGVLEEAAAFATASDPQALATGDFNGDGLTDLVVINSQSARASVYWNQKLSRRLSSGPANAAAVAPDQVLATGAAVAAAVGDVNGDGLDDIVVPNPLDDPVLGSTIGVYLQGPGGLLGVELDDGTHGQSLSLAAGQGAQFAAVGDLNGDGLKDVVVTNTVSTNAHVFHQRASGSGLGRDADARGRFTPDVHLCTERSPGKVFVGDINGDEREDVLICGLLSTVVRIYHQKDGGVLGLPPDGGCGDGFSRHDRVLDGTGFNLSSLAIGDLNRDALNDVVAVDEANFRAGVFWQRPSGELGAPPDGEGRVAPDRNLRTGRRCPSVAIADLDGDARNDVVLVSQENNTVEVYLQGDGGALGLEDGGQTPALPSQRLSARGAPAAIATADLNGDGHPDVIVGNGESSTVGLYLQVFAGALIASPIELVAGASPQAVALGEVNGDGRTDVLVLSKGSGTLGVHLQTLSGGVPSAASQVIAVGLNPVALAIGDVDGDGGNDVVVVSQSSDQSSAVSAYPGEGAAEGGLPFDPGRRREIVRASGLVAVAVGDLDSDGRNDVLAVNPSNDTLSIFLQKGGGAFGEEPDQVLTTDRNPAFAAIGDLNGDGRSDVAVVNRNANTACVYFQGAGPERLLGSSEDAGGRFLPDLRLQTDGFPVFVAIGDVGGDGANDLLALNRAAETVGVYIQGPSWQPGAGADGTGLIVPDQLLRTGRGPESMAIGDMDGDLRNDVVVVNATSSPPVAGVYLQGASGVLGRVHRTGEPASPNRELSTGEFPVSVAVGDLNGDGRNDCVIANRERGNAPDYTVGLYLAR